MKVYFFTYGNSASSLDYIHKLQPDEFADVYHVIQCLENEDFEIIGARKWQGKIYEVHFRKNNRLFYVLDAGVIWILYACKKSKKKTSKVDVNKIKILYQRFLNWKNTDANK